MRKLSLRSLKKKAWKLFSPIVRQMWADHRGMVQCVTCGKEEFWQNMDAGHFIAKNKGNALWFDCRNVHPQCRYCNLFLRGNLINYTKFMIHTYGEDEVERLQSLAGPKKVTRSDYLDLIEHLESCKDFL